MGMWVLCFVAWLLKRAWEVLSGESMVMWGGAQRGTTAACFPYYYSWYAGLTMLVSKSIEPITAYI